MVELLLESGANPHKTDYSGRSAFDMSLQIANKQIIQLLEKCTMATSVKEMQPASIHHGVKVKRTKN